MAAALDDPVRFTARCVSEFGHFWELYPTRLTVDHAEGRAELHRRDARLPEDVSFSRSWRNTVSALSFGVELGLAVVGMIVSMYLPIDQLFQFSQMIRPRTYTQHETTGLNDAMDVVAKRSHGQQC